MQTEKQKWVEDVLKSADGTIRANAPDIADAVFSRMNTAGRYTIATSTDNSMIWRIAASVVFLLLLNVVTIYSYQSSMNRSVHALDARAAASELGIGQSTANDPGSVIFGN